MDTISLDRKIETDHFISQARSWLEKSENGKRSVPICYAAFEIRLAVERICMDFYINLVGSKEAKADSKTLGSFKKMKAKIFDNVGHQKIIDEQFEFARCLLKALEIDTVVPTPNLGRLSSIWHDCSEACHIFWNVGKATEYEKGEYDPYSDLVAYANELAELSNGNVTWFTFMNPQMKELMEKVKGTEDCVELLREHFSKEGLRAVLTSADGKHEQVIGKPIDPQGVHHDSKA